MELVNIFAFLFVVIRFFAMGRDKQTNIISATPSRMAPVQIRAPLKSKVRLYFPVYLDYYPFHIYFLLIYFFQLIVFEDAASPVNEKEADEEDDEVVARIPIIIIINIILGDRYLRSAHERRTDHAP